MTLQRTGSPFLYDETTGDIVGVKDSDGGESYLGRTAEITAAQLAALTTGQVGVTYEVTDLPGRPQYRWDGSALMPTNSVRAGDASRTVGGALEQQAGITTPASGIGKLVCNFTGAKWPVVSGAAVATQDHTGWNGSGVATGVVSRTSQPGMLKIVPAANTLEEIRLTVNATNLPNPATGGRLGLWVYVEALPGYQVGGTVTGQFNLTISTGASDTNALYVSVNTNQIREGWNFIKFVQRNPQAYAQGSGVVEYNPFGVNAIAFGTGADANIKDNPITRIKIGWQNMLGATLYFDSIWSGWESTAQVVLGSDGGENLLTYGLPGLQQYGWLGYAALTMNTVDSGTANNTLQTVFPAVSDAAELYMAGWDLINHTLTHPSVGTYAAEKDIAYQLDMAKAWALSQGFERGSEFYASPQSSSSRLSEAVIKARGYKLQRHARKWNVSVTPWGIDNPHFVGGIDMGSATTGVGVSSVTGGASGSITGWQTATKIKRAIDVAVAYGDAIFPYWHGITTVGDTGAGEDLTGSDLLISKSAFDAVLAHVRQLQLAGSVRIPKGVSGFYYGRD